MSKAVPIGVYNIARTAVDKDEVKRWLAFVGVDVDTFQIPDDGAVSNPAFLIALAAKRCYKSFEAGLNPNVTKIRKDYGEYIDNILKSGHGSVRSAHAMKAISMLPPMGKTRANCHARTH